MPSQSPPLPNAPNLSAPSHLRRWTVSIPLSISDRVAMYSAKRVSKLSLQDLHRQCQKRERKRQASNWKCVHSALPNMTNLSISFCLIHQRRKKIACSLLWLSYALRNPLRNPRSGRILPPILTHPLLLNLKRPPPSRIRIRISALLLELWCRVSLWKRRRGRLGWATLLRVCMGMGSHRERRRSWLWGHLHGWVILCGRVIVHRADFRIQYA